MTLYISNFKTKFRIAMIFLAIFVVLISEIAFRDAYPESSNYEIRDQLNNERPDIILIGNSMLGTNVEKKSFDAELSKLTNRNITSKFIHFGASRMPAFYLILSQQIATSNLSNIPVGIVAHTSDAFLTVSFVGLSNSIIKENMHFIDPVFSRKFPDSNIFTSFRLKNISNLLYYSPEASSKILDYFVGTIMSEKYNSIVTNNVVSRFRGLTFSQIDILKDSEINSLTSNTEINKSFIPDAINVSSNFSLFFVSSRTRPALSEDKIQSHLNFISKLSNYLGEKDIKLINTRDFKELNNDSLFRDDFHLTTHGRIIEGKKLAQEIFARGLIE